MTYKEFCEGSEIEYTLFVTINGEDSIRLSSASEAGLLEQFHKLDKQIDNKLTEQFEDEPENYEQ